MDFVNHNPQSSNTPVSNSQIGGSNHASNALPNSNHHNKGGKFANRQLLRIGSVALLFAITILVAATLGMLYLGGPNQTKFIDKTRYQAVFLNNGQVYFGQIKEITDNYVDLTRIYYLQSSTPPATSTAASPNTATSNNVTLIKLGCELHAPYDQMLINLSQVSFWENVQDSGQVAQGIAKLKTCTPASATPASTPASTTNSTNKP